MGSVARGLARTHLAVPSAYGKPLAGRVPLHRPYAEPDPAERAALVAQLLKVRREDGRVGERVCVGCEGRKEATVRGVNMKKVLHAVRV